MTAAISVRGLTRHYRGHRALDDVTIDIDGPSITGLLGRNGAGKTTLLRMIAAQELPSRGRVLVFGVNPLENDAILRRLVLIREDQTFPDFKVRHALKAASWFYPNWDGDLAAAMAGEFDLPPDRAVKKLSRGMRSALSIVIGLAARAEITLFDEPYAGLDAVARQLFYDRLLAEYAEHPRTILLSTHLVDEAAALLERVVMVDRGRVVLDAPADDLRGAYTSVSGPAAAVAQLLADRPDRPGQDRRRVAAHESVVLAGPLDSADLQRARDLHLRLEPLSLQQVLVHAAGRSDSERSDSERSDSERSERASA
ncbi:ABC-2 type transport system ATP-binding protein [Parafrankia irregularis]|uniref:ABC-2 type transport system ATP-binding protein n=1 Tax=Parafrankia irregularis TaxID=795642 RepID=A0A0S4QHU4_9ACTN|nr:MULTISPECIES: ABC transporter ATP-binding protein [Parafrankia]MBE3203985.1 ABC transporter ATP-binding protein [Parafrankia sp. CH37]CUU55141.1 ABC-2 type transport system ATP-binding protein [Parafrankia irregularis]